MRFEVCKFVRTQEVRKLTTQELACKDNDYFRFDNLTLTIFLQKGYKKNGKPRCAASRPVVHTLFYFSECYP